MKQSLVRRLLSTLVIALWLPVPILADGRTHGAGNLADQAGLSKVEPTLLKRALKADRGVQHRFIVELAHQARLTAFTASPSRPQRQRDVVTLLQSTASQTQAGLLAYLQARQADGQVDEIHPFWILNGLAVTADTETLFALAARTDVRTIREDRWQQWVEPSSEPENLHEPDEGDIEWNITRVRADLAWSALGLDGSGVTLAIMDTGVDWQHPALQTQYRGYKSGGLAFHEGNWACTTDEGYLYPVDGHGHGTYVAGLAVGGEGAGGQAIGMAPGAQWVAVKMLDDAGYGYDSWIHAAFEWIMAPDNDPALAPHVVNGSWGIANAWDETFRLDLQALRAAGILPVFAAGNGGPSASSLSSPGSLPEAIGVGATDDLDQVTQFSSRGPSPWNEIKPEVVAPGAQVRSSLPGGTYNLGNGTSAAAPHVSGLAALLLQADPSLTVDDIEVLVTSTASPLGKQVPNNDTGWGRIDAYQSAAVALTAGFVTGKVSSYPSQQPLPAAQVSAYDPLGEPQVRVQTDDAGRYHLAVPSGRYDLMVEAFGYTPQTMPDIEVQSALTTTLDFVLMPEPAGVLSGQVTSAETGLPVGAALSILGTPAQTTSDPETGRYSFSLPVGTYALQVAQNGYQRHITSEIVILADQDKQINVALTLAPTLLLVDSGRWYYDSQASYFGQALDDRACIYDLWEIRDLDTDLPTLDDLSNYEITVWSSPLDSPGLIGAGDTISNYLGIGGNLLLTGQDVGFWDNGLNGRFWHEYYSQFLKVEAVDDDASHADVVGLPDEILDGLSLQMNGPDSAENQRFPDSIALLDPRDAAIIGYYADDGEAIVRASECQSYRAFYLAAGLEGLGDRASRAEVMDRALTWLDAPHPAVGVELYPADQDQIWLASGIMTYTVELRNTGQATDRFALTLSPSAWAASVWDATFSYGITQTTALDACQTHTLGLQVTVPPDVDWNTTDVVTLTAYSLSDPAVSVQAEFHSKAPAPILLVDDHRWYDTLAYYQTALEANQLPYDIWTVPLGLRSEVASPSLQRLQRYPVVIWFTAYDWYENLMPVDEERLAAYLDDGGRLLLSSQDYLSTIGLTDFSADYLGVANFTKSLTTTQVVAAVDSPLNIGPDPLDLVYPFRNRSDTLRPSPAAQPAFWGQHGQPAALTLGQPPWRTAFFAFPLEAFPPKEMAEILGLAVDWLSPLGDSTFTVDRPVAFQGEQVVYTLRISNSGPTLLSGVTLSNTIPLSGTYVADSLEGPADYDPATGRITWQGALSPGQTVTVSYRVQLDASLPAGTAVHNVVHLRDESGLAVERVAVSRLRTPDLSTAAKTVSAVVARPAQAVTYTLSLRNDGLSPAQAHLSDPIPLHTAYLAGSAQASGGVLTPTAEALLWSGSIPVGQAVTITFPVVISPSATSSYILNRASLDDGWGNVRALEAPTWVEACSYLPLIFKRSPEARTYLPLVFKRP